MQWKLPKPSRTADRLHRWAFRRGFPFLLHIAPRIPRWMLHVGAWIVIFLVMLVYPRPKKAIRRNLAHVLGLSPGSWKARRATWRMLHNFSCSWADLFRYAQLPTRDLEDVTRSVRGLEHLEGCAGRGGTVLLTAHLGCWEVGGLILTGRGYPASVVYVADKYPEAEEFRSLLRGKGDIDEICMELGSAWNVLPILRALKDGRMVAVQGDRDPSDRESPVPVLGRLVSLPRGPFLVSYLTGAPILPVFVVYGEGFCFEVVIEEPLELDRSQDREAAIEQALQDWTVILGRAIQRWPTQWYTFYDYWG